MINEREGNLLIGAGIDKLEKIAKPVFLSLYNKRTLKSLLLELEEDTVLTRVTAANKMFPSDDELEISELLYNKKNIAYCMIDYDLENIILFRI